MTSLVRLAKRAGGLEVAAFQRAAVRTCDWSSAVPYGLRSATQALTLQSGYRHGEPIYDVVDELAFEDETAAERCLADPVVRLAARGELLEPSSITWLIVDLHVARPGAIAANYVKNYEIVRKRPDLDRAEFDRYWIEVHGPLAAQIPTIRRYVQAHLAPRLRDSGTAPFDGLAITWWDDVDAMRAGTRSDAYSRTRADEGNFLAGELPFVITTERITYPAETT